VREQCRYGRKSTDDAVDMSLSAGTTNFWTVLAFSKEEAKLAGRSSAGY